MRLQQCCATSQLHIKSHIQLGLVCAPVMAPPCVQCVSSHSPLVGNSYQWLQLEWEVLEAVVSSNHDIILDHTWGCAGTAYGNTWYMCGVK